MASSERSISDVLTDIVHNIQDIVRSEIRLAKTEVAEDWRKVRAAGVLLGVGALLGAYGGFFILLCIVNALSQVMPGWAAALAVGVVLAIIALVLVSSASARLKRASNNPAPKTVATLKENVQWAKHQIK
ncbi:MAG: phage holin family protein [Gammaproteobacteria bacterium]|nr:phage holin family protein [Gammaproteobacteria bacterium]